MSDITRDQEFSNQFSVHFCWSLMSIRLGFWWCSEWETWSRKCYNLVSNQNM